MLFVSLSNYVFSISDGRPDGFVTTAPVQHLNRAATARSGCRAQFLMTPCRSASDIIRRAPGRAERATSLPTTCRAKLPPVPNSDASPLFLRVQLVALAVPLFELLDLQSSQVLAEGDANQRGYDLNWRGALPGPLLAIISRRGQCESFPYLDSNCSMPHRRSQVVNMAAVFLDASNFQPSAGARGVACLEE